VPDRMEWPNIWRTVFVGWDGDVDLTALAEELRHRAHTSPLASDEHDRASTWVRQQIQRVY